MSDPETAEHLEILKQTPARLKDLLKGVPKQLLLWAPAPGKWSILEIVGHLRDMERDAYLARYRRILAEDEPALPDIDGDVYALEHDYRASKLGEVLRDWQRLRRECLALLRTVKRDQWQRSGVHPTAGSLTMAAFLRRQAVGNDEAHLAQITAIKRRHAILARLSAAPARLATAVKGWSDDALRRQLDPDHWSAVEVLCHLRDIERIYAERFSKMAFSERPQLWMMDNSRVAALKRYREADPSAVLRELRALRADTLSLLRALPHAVWQRTGLHPKRGELTIEQLAELVAGHDDSHLAQLESLRPAAPALA